MDHYDFESTITDADFDFTLDDILNEFHSGGPSSAMDETQQDAVSDIHAVISQQNNNPIYGSGIEGASTINTNEFEDSVMNGSDLTTPDVSGAPETEAYEGSNPYDYQSVYFVFKISVSHDRLSYHSLHKKKAFHNVDS